MTQEIYTELKSLSAKIISDINLLSSSLVTYYDEGKINWDELEELNRRTENACEEISLFADTAENYFEMSLEECE